ncbi:MAG: aminotransferase class V-fold PLP-dependent enzyme [Clostridiales bacterium]|nr:aminotransferase class V-fold PLP-dependent enzyme [Clostridiales bacterium]
MIYFDNSSTTFYKPPEVIQSVAATLTNLSVNAGRSGHSLAIKAMAALSNTRAKAANFFRSEIERTIFTYGCTDSLNIAIFGSVHRSGHVITTAFEHNSVLRPLFKLQADGQIELTVVKPRSDGTIHSEDILRAIKRNTYLIVMNSVSNVIGLPLPVEQVAKALNDSKIMLLVDGAQSVGYRSYDYSLFDMIAVAPHKGLHAPQGIGLLILGEKATISPIRLGGTGTVSQSVMQPLDLPEALESGTLPLPSILGLHAALCHTIKNQKAYSDKISMLGNYMYSRLKSIQGITVYTTDPTAGIIAFNADKLNSVECASMLDEMGFCVRSGLHCAPLLHKAFGTLNKGMVRASLGVDNTLSQIDMFIESLAEIVK